MQERLNKMKIGILTYHRSHNYGALLQAIALRKVLSDMGHEAHFIDYWPAYHRHVYALFSLSQMISQKGLKRKVYYLTYCINNYTCRKERKETFEKFIQGYIEPYISSVDESYDVVVHGSDQIWRKQPEIRTYNPVYFGKHNISAGKKITYAASMGILPEKESDRMKIKDYLGNLNSISVRERNLFEVVKSLGYNGVHQDVDPTLLLTSNDWVKILSLKKQLSEEKYALYYKIQNSFDVNSLQRFAESRGLKLKIIHSKAIGHNTDFQITTAGPSEFVDLIYNAEFVFTSSFHGLAFSLLFHKPFLTSFTNNAGRAASLLASLDLSDHLLFPNAENITYENEVDYDRVEMLLEQMRKISKDSLATDIELND